MKIKDKSGETWVLAGSKLNSFQSHFMERIINFS